MSLGAVQTADKREAVRKQRKETEVEDLSYSAGKYRNSGRVAVGLMEGAVASRSVE